MKVGAIWCPECAIMRPRWEKVKSEFPDLEIEEMDYDKDQETRKRYNIDHVPTVIFLEGENELGRLKGLLETEEMIKEIKKYL
mgnify:CR=1 FL=1